MSRIPWLQPAGVVKPLSSAYSFNLSVHCLSHCSTVEPLVLRQATALGRSRAIGARPPYYLDYRFALLEQSGLGGLGIVFVQFALYYILIG